MIYFVTFAGALTLGSFGFWLFWGLAVVALFILIILADNEHWAWATALGVAALIGMGSLGVFNVYHFAVEHPGVLLGDFGCYVLLGMIWGAVKWWRFCRLHRHKYEEAKLDFLRSKNATQMTPLLRVEWTDRLRNANRWDRYNVLYSEPPNWKNHKEKIINWMYLWPFSFLATFFSDFFHRLWVNLCGWMGGLYTSIARAVWAGTEKDLASAEDFAEFQKLQVEKK